MTWAIMILDLPFTTPMLSETSKRKKMRFWSIGLFFYPSIAFFTKPRFWFGSTFFSRTFKRLFCVVFRALASGRTTSHLRRGILFEICSLAGNCKMILAMVQLMWCSSCCHCFGNTCVTYKKKHRMCWKEICTDSDSRGSVWKWWHGFPTTMGIN